MAKKVLSTVSKTLLSNVVRHTDTHNRIVEQDEMWRQRENELRRRDTSYSFLDDRRTDMRYEFGETRERRAHMDDEPQSTHWMKQLYQAEEADTNRWGHNGFRELYPDKFESSDSSSSDRSYHRHSHRSRKEEKSRSSRKRRKRSHSDASLDSDSEKRRKRKRKHKSKDKEKKKKRKHKSKKRRRKETSEESDSG